ncbi:tumor necrosis factor receptor superfamily member 6 [Erethizon dorsatum]
MPGGVGGSLGLRTPRRSLRPRRRDPAPARRQGSSCLFRSPSLRNDSLMVTDQGYMAAGASGCLTETPHPLVVSAKPVLSIENLTDCQASDYSFLPFGGQTFVFTFIAGPLSKTANARVTDTSFEGLELKSKVTKAETQCSEGLHRGGQFCCQPCPPGKRKAADCKSDEGEPECVLCKEGEEYTDKQHYSPKCRRCTFCDAGHGLEVDRNCTRTQDTTCRCKPNFYCSTSVCEHCEPCITCEHGIIEKCTPTSNTKCKKEITGSGNNLWWLCILIIPIGLALGLYVRMKYCRNNHLPHEYFRSNPPQETETVPLNFSDVDFSKYIPRIAELMTINEVKELVRKNGVPEAKIDDIKNDSPQDVAEQKVQLLRSWYQVNGKKNACHTFIKSLKEANFYAYAQRVQDIIQADMRNNHENSNLTSENERQSLA